MPYKCGWGHTSYDPMCEACDAEVLPDDAYERKEETEEKFKAALEGKTRDEWLEDQEGEWW